MINNCKNNSELWNLNKLKAMVFKMEGDKVARFGKWSLGN